MGRRTIQILRGLLLFNAVSAIGGGLGLMVGLLSDHPSLIEHSDFPSLYFPGVVLFAIVGGSALIAALALVHRSTGWELVCLVSGVVMVVWIVGEVASLRAVHPLHVLYLVTGVAVLWSTLRASAQPVSAV